MHPSALELLHPDGSAPVAVVHGDGPESLLARSLGREPTGAPDLVLLTPSPGQRSDGAWTAEAVDLANGVGPDGLVVAVAPTGRLRGELARGGLQPELRLLHVPNVLESRYVFPLHGPAARYALRRLVPLHPVKRVASRLLAAPGAGLVAPTTVVFRRPGARPLLEWLSALDGRGEPGTAIVRRGWHPVNRTVVHRFGPGPEPDAVVKLGANVPAEARALTAFGAAAQSAHAAIPRLVAEGEVGGVPLLVENPLPGTPAPGMLRHRPGAVGRLLRIVAAWLAEWNAATADVRPFEHDDAERHVLARARRVAPLWPGGAAHVAHLEHLCARAVGTNLPFVTAHNDLTSANVLLDHDGRVGIVDWERSADQCLPLGDLAYAAADLAAAVHGYRDRPAAYSACFEPGGEFSAITSELLLKASSSYGIDARGVELCLHACWLLHAENERNLTHFEDLDERPFLEILKRAAAGAPT